MMSLLWGQDLTGRLHPSSAVLEPRSSRTSVYSIRSTSTPKPPWQVESSDVPAIEETKEAKIENLDIEKTAAEPFDRPAIYTSSIYTGVAVFIMTALLFGGALRTLVVETAIDGQYIRLALAVTLPFSGSLALPTIHSLKEAVSHYELHGGTANIFVNDDGMQLIDPALAEERKEFYRDNGIGWVARPKHGENGYLRAGKFKKASNMNFGLEISNKTEDILNELIDARHKKRNELLSSKEIDDLYTTALGRVTEEDKRAWASGNIRVGEIILIVDSDTRVPADCLIYGAAEMFLCPEVAIIQHSAGVMQVVEDYFENGITYFTNLIYSAIRFVCGSGDVAPFVGHNAFLRWQAVQSVAFWSENREYYWSESHVSEDFDMALRLQVAGNVVRLATYHGLRGFQEGVSLTIYDELARWEKYHTSQTDSHNSKKY
ncbi:hypothetical protein TWF679_011251 [Orbilia oligospora]|uniref:Glycosyltransferase 2-like domain-containing protein n=1 Tax=Orbilia oligospora TaxID=2813651 RepID=A0A8H8UYE3_ORBOL|nr:hypothetical protein TWF679_011251 [Orbilia oligospora]